MQRMLLVSLVAACSGQISMGSLIGRPAQPPQQQPGTLEQPTPAASATPAAAPRNRVAEAGELWDLAMPAGYSEKDPDATLLTMPKFFQANTFSWARSRGAWKLVWLADMMGDQLSETARMEVVAWCLHGKEDDLAWIACQGDAHRMDKNKLLAELQDPDAAKYRTSVLQEFDKLQQEVATRDAEIAKREKNDPALAQILDVVPKLVWKQWDELSTSAAATLDLARRLELASQKPLPMAKHGKSRKAYAGCDEALAPAFAKAVKSATTKGLELGGTFGIARTPETYIATLAAYYCAQGQDLAISGALGKELTDYEMLRGPRMASIEAALAKSATLKFDDTDYALKKFVWRDFNYVNEDEELFPSIGGGHGVIASVAAQGDMLHIAFKKEKYDYEECTKREPAKNEWHYDRNTGNISQVEYCVASVTKSEMHEVKPIDVPASQAAALQAGRFLDYQTTGRRSTEAHAVRAVWDSPKQKKLLAIYGVARQ